MNTPKGDIRVLLVDDTPLSIEGLSLTLNGLGYTRIQQAEDGPKALGLAKKYRPHLVLMDTRMPPGQDGYEVCRQMRQEDYGKMAAILGMSGNDNFALRKQWREAGADGFFPKDIIDKDLDALIQKALKKYQQ